MKRAIYWGIGDYFKNKILEFPFLKDTAVAYVDSKRSGEKIENEEIISPELGLAIEYDVIVITSENYAAEIYKNIVEDYNIESSKIVFINTYIVDSLINTPRPQSVRLDASTICQLVCKTCYMRLKDYGTVGKGYLSAINFEKFLVDNPFVKHVELSNSGEMFLNPDLANIIKCAYEKGVKLTAYVGVNFNHVTDEVVESLVKYKFDTISVSIDGFHQEIYSNYRCNGNIDKVLNNIERLNAMKAKYNSENPRLIWKYILMQHNEEDVEDAISAAKRLGMEIKFSTTWDRGYQPTNPDYLKKLTGLEYLTKEDYNQNHVRNLHDYDACMQLFQMPQINWDGRLLGCCRVFQDDFGINVFDVGLEKALSNINVKIAKKLLVGELKNSNKISNIPCSACGTYRDIENREIYYSTDELCKEYKSWVFKGDSEL